MLRLGLLCLLFGLTVGDTVVLNELVDQMLSGLSQELVNSGKDQLTVSRIDEDWEYRWHRIKFSGHCNCEGGYARSLASIYRTGDVVMSTSGNAITLRVALGLRTLEFGFNSCQVKANHLFSVTQPIDVKVTRNSIAAQVTVVKNGAQCTANVDRLELDNLGRIRVDTGSSVLHKIEDHLIEWLTSLAHGQIVNGINSGLQDAARKNVNKVDFCSKLPFPQ